MVRAFKKVKNELFGVNIKTKYTKLKDLCEKYKEDTEFKKEAETVITNYETRYEKHIYKPCFS